MKYLFLLLLLLSGCSVISYDRVFPKLGWYWSWEAKAQREEKRIHEEYVRTNTVNHL